MPFPIAAQYTKSSYFETWTDLITIYNINDRFRYDGTYGVRAWLSTEDFTQISLRPSVRYEVQPWLRLHGGLGWFHTFFRVAGDVDELRPWLGIRFAGPRPGGFLIQNYFRLEFRVFEFQTDGTRSTAWRGRWQLQVRSPDFSVGSAERFYSLASVEFFHTFGAEIQGFAAERLRLNLGVLHMISTAAMIRLGRVYRNYMVGVRPTNRKLVERACSIIASVTGTDRTTAARALRGAGRDARLAIVMIRTGLDRKAAGRLLARHGGNLRELLSSL